MHRRRLVLTAAALLGGGRAASAHARLRAAIPAPGAVLDTAPREVSIVFSEALEPLFSRIEVADIAGHRVEEGRAHSGADAKALVVTLKPLLPGDYRVAWWATSIDTHKTEGSFGFTLRG